MRNTVVVAAALILALACGSSMSRAQDAVAACRGLANPINTAKFLAIPEAPTSIISAIVVKAGGEGTIVDQDLPEICRVEGFITPSIGFLLRMPTKTWNGKFMMGGCGSGCGNYLEDRIDPALVRNYAVVTTDMGHKGLLVSFSQFTNTLQGQVDFSHRATHVTAIAAKILLAEFYGKKAARNYFWGCSTGGNQAMVESQLYPLDFEGIIAGAPGWGVSPTYTALRDTMNRGPNDTMILKPARLPLVHKAVMEACDALDGLKDGILQDPRKCKWDPSALLCKAGQNPNACLSPDEAMVVRRFYDGPTDEKGRKLSWPLMEHGSEIQWGRYDYELGESNGMLAVYPRAQDVPRAPTEPWFRYARNPDLRPLKQAGGKLILFTGWDDNNVPPGGAVDYYETATKTMGGEKATKEFFRFFTLPAANHCRYGFGGGEADWITTLEDWVEKGKAPDVVIAHHLIADPYPSVPRNKFDYGAAYSRMPRFPLPEGSYDRTRPVYAYPDLAKYSGKGDPNKAETWKMAPR